MAPESATLAAPETDDLSDLGGQVVYKPKPQPASPAGPDDLSDLGAKLVYHPDQAKQQTAPPAGNNMPAGPSDGNKITGPSVAEGQNEGWMPKGGGPKPLGNNPVFRPGDAPALQQPITHPPNAPAATYAPSAQESADLPPRSPAPAPAAPTATMGASSPGLIERGLDVLRNSPLGHSIQTEFPGAPDWMKPTTRQGTPEYEAEQEQLRPEQLVQGVTQDQANKALKVATGGMAAPLPAGTFRENAGAAPTPTEERATGFLKSAGELASAPSVATQVAIAAGTGGLGEILAAPLVPAVAGKVVHALIGAGFTAQMASSVIDDIKAYRDAKEKGDDHAANEAMGRMALSGAMTALAGLGTVHEGRAALEEHRAARPAEQPAAQPDVANVTDGTNVPHVPRETSQAESTTSNITIGDKEPETGRTVMQQSAKPEVSQAAATAEHPDIKSQIQDAMKPVGGARLVGERDEKTPERVEEKIEDEGQSPRTMRDFSGFRIAVDSPSAAQRAVDALRNKFEVIDESNEFHEGNPETGFHGWTVQVREPGSPVSHEVQVVPREVAETADARHPLYEKAREGDADAAAELKKANDQDWQKFQERHGEQPAQATTYKYGNTQTNIPEGSEASKSLNNFRDAVFDEDLAGQGKDVGDGGNHVTVRYGINSDNTQGIERFIRSQKPFRAKLGETEVFPPSKNSDGASVLVAKIDSPEFHQMNDEIQKHGSFAPSDFDEYKPHATIAYLDPDKAKKYAGRDDIKGRDFEVKSITISDRNGGQREIPLEGKTEAQDGAAPQVERRANSAERKRVSEMSPEEMKRTLLTSDVTGLPNRRAFDEAERGQRSPAVAMSDADGLKGLNDKFGYEAGNALLRAKAEALQHAGLDAYHDKGDEFLFRGEAPEDLKRKLEAAREDLRNRTIEVTLADGTKREFKGADFSYGTGQNTATAEAGLKEHKAQREARGERARGELRGITEVGSQRGEERAGAAEKPADRFRQLARQRDERIRSTDREETDLFGNPVKKATGPVAPGDVGRMPVTDLKLDPKRFQYKMNTDASGVTNLLKGRKWNEDLAGLISVWRDPEDGQTYVVNGHHRFQLAEENGRPDVSVRMIDAPTAPAARATGALQNIAEGRGTAMDAAKFFRDSGFTPERLDDLGVSMGEATAANGIALSRLDPSLFDQVVNGRIPEGRAIAIGNATANPAEQESILKLIQKAESKGKHVTNETVNELARMVKGAGEHTESQATLFGAQEMTRNLALEKAEISSYIRKEIGTVRRTFESVSDEKRAARLGVVKGQKITAAQNADIAEKARHAQELYDRLSVRSGTIDEILNRAARELAEGGKPNDVKARAYEDARRELAQTLRTGADSSRAGVQAKPGAGPEANGQARQQPRAATTGEPPRTVEKGAPVTLADGKAGVIEHYQPSVNGGPERVRVRLTDGTMREGVKPQDVKPIPAPAEHPGEEWIGVDFDKTLAHYDTFKGPEYTGKPLPEMVERVKNALADGKNVKIFTARVADDPTGRAKAALEAWSQEHIGQALPVTNIKDQHMAELWDDRAKQAIPNTGRLVEGAENAENEPSRQASAQVDKDVRAPSSDRVEAANGEHGTVASARGERQPAVAGDVSARVVPDIRAAGVARRPGESTADLQERLLAKGRFNRELDAARGRKASQNVQRAQIETRSVGEHQVHVLNPDAYSFIEKQLTPGETWIGATLDRSATSRWIAELRAAESLARQKRLPAEADAFKKLALQFDSLRDPEGGLILLRGDYDDATMREELIHKWQQRTGLYGSAALDAITRLPEVERTIQGLDEIGYKGVKIQERTAEALAKAMAGDPDWTLSLSARKELVKRFLTAAVDEMGPQVLDNLPPVLPELEPTIREVQEYGRQQTEGEGPGAARRGPGQTGEGEPGSRGTEGSAPNPPGQRGPVPERTREATEQDRSPKDKLKELFARRRGAPVRPEDSLALPGMEDVDRERADREASEQANQLTEAMKKPLGDISGAAGKMERDSPLFFGTGDNPTLFKKAVEPSQKREVFAESKATDEHGDPLTLYHGTPRGGFDKFKPDVLNPNSLYGSGIYMTADPSVASSYAEHPLTRNDLVHDDDLRRYFTPGRIVDGYGGPDRVLEFRENGRWGGWEVKVERVDKNGNATEPPRWHSTRPDAPEVARALNQGHAVYPLNADIRKPFDANRDFTYEEAKKIFGKWNKTGWLEMVYHSGEEANRALDAKYETGALPPEPPADAAISGEDLYRAAKQSFSREYENEDPFGHEPNEEFQERELPSRDAYSAEDQVNAALKQSGYDGIRHEGGKVFKTKKHDVWIAFDPKQVYSAYGASPLFKREPREAGGSAEEEEPDRMVALHNTSAEGIRAAEKLGGIPAPSFAVLKPGMDFHGYGDITLVGNKRMIDPNLNPDSRLYESDVYSPRQPRASRKLIEREADKFENEIRKAMPSDAVAEALGARYGIRGKFNSYQADRPEELIRQYKNDEAVQYAWLKSKGLEPTFEPTPVRRQFPFLDRPEVKAAIDKNPAMIEDIDKLDHRQITELVRDAHHASIDEDVAKAKAGGGKAGPEVARVLEATKKEWEKQNLDENGLLHYNPLDKAFRDLRNIQSGKQEIDRYEAREKIRNAMKTAGGTEAMEPWLNEKLANAFGPEYLQTGRGKKPYTIDNVREAMLGSGIRGQEDTMTQGLGKARASAARQFKDIEQMRRNRGQIVPEEEAKKAHDELQNRFFDWRKALTYNYPDQWDSLDSLGKAIGRYLKGPKTEAGMRRALLSEDYKDEGLDSETLQAGMKLASDVQNAPVEYFEAKLRNSTSLGDYSGAAVPKNAPEDVKQMLRSKGLRVEEYDSKDRSARAEAIARLHDVPGTLFRRDTPTTVTTGEHDTGKAIEDTVRELERIPSRKMSPSERIDTASKLAVDQVKDGASAISKAGASLKGTWAGIVDSANSPAPWTSFFESLKGLRQGEFKAALELDKYQKRMRDVAPNPREREAMTVYGEARDEEELKKQATQARAMAKYRGPDPEKASAAKAFAKHAQAYEDALNLNDRQKQIAQEHARYYDSQLQILMDAGLLPKGASRYAMHMFAGDPEALAQAQAAADLSELAPNPAFLKRRVYKSYFDAMTHGEMPRTLDSGKILSAYHDAFTKTFLTRGFLRTLIEGHDETDGRPLAALESRSGFSYVKDDSAEAKQIIRQPRRPADLTGYVRLPASQLKNFKWELTDADRELLAPGYKEMPEAEQQKLFGGDDSQYPAKPGEILALKGDVLLHPKYAGRVSDLLNRSALDRAQQDAILEAGRKAVKGIQTAGAKLKSGILTYSLFHQTQLGVHALEHMTNPMRLGELSDLAKDPIVLEGVGHGLNLLNVDSEGVLASHLGLPGMETYHRYLFRDYIPRLKAETYKNAYRRNLKRYSGDLTTDEIHLLTAKQVNNGFGGLDPAFFRHLYRMNNKTWRSLEHLAFFSPDFTKARLGFVGQAFGKYGAEQRMALGLGLITIYSASRIANQLLTGDAHWNWRDALQVEIPKSVPLIGGQRVGLRTVQADMLNLIKDPASFAYNRLNPVTLRPTIEFLTGRDNFGRQQTDAHFAKNYAKQMTPIAVQKLFTTSDDRWADALLQSAGVESGKYRTPLETVAHELYIKGLPDMPDDEDKQAEARSRVQRVEEIRRASDDPQKVKELQDNVWKDAEAGKMTQREAKALLERASMTELQYEVSRMKTIEDALKVWDQANASEREELHDVIEQKAARQTKNMDDEQAQAFIAKLKDKGIDLE